MSLQIFSEQTKIDFIGLRYYAYALSAVLLIAGLVAFFMHGGLRYGVDLPAAPPSSSSLRSR